MRGRGDVKVYGCKAMEVYGCKAMKVHGCNDTEMHGCNDMEMHGCNDIEMCGCSGCLDAWTWIPQQNRRSILVCRDRNRGMLGHALCEHISVQPVQVRVRTCVCACMLA